MLDEKTYSEIQESVGYVNICGADYDYDLLPSEQKHFQNIVDAALNKVELVTENFQAVDFKVEQVFAQDDVILINGRGWQLITELGHSVLHVKSVETGESGYVWCSDLEAQKTIPIIRGTNSNAVPNPKTQHLIKVVSLGKTYYMVAITKPDDGYIGDYAGYRLLNGGCFYTPEEVSEYDSWEPVEL